MTFLASVAASCVDLFPDEWNFYLETIWQAEWLLHIVHTDTNNFREFWEALWKNISNFIPNFQIHLEVELFTLDYILRFKIEGSSIKLLISKYLF